ncbi:MAG: hypothetical protein Q4C78_03570 [Synergistaceae bacterium]|nr:hypothetical protein [Synergistaceae bacterium]
MTYRGAKKIMAMTAMATFRTRRELKKRIDFLARTTHRPTSFYYNLLLEDYLYKVEGIYLTEQILTEIRSGKQKTYTADEVFAEAGL